MFFCLAGLVGCGPFAAQAAEPSAPSPSGQNLPAAGTISYGDAVVLGLVEGVTEYLPVSSTGHLVVASQALKLDSDAPLIGHDGQPIITTHHGETKPLTLKDAVDNYNIIIQGGAILAVLLLYWPRVLSLFRGVVGLDPQGLLVLRNLLVAFLPSAVLGLLAEHWISAHLFSARVVAAAFALGAVIMLAAERWRQRHGPGAITSAGPEISELSWRQSLLIGVWQCLSLWPGMSRSMTTIVGGYQAGLRPSRAAEFSFLLGLMTLTAASGYKAVGHYAELRAALPLGPLAVGLLVATVSAFVAVRWFVGWLTRYGLSAFAWYRLAAAGVILWIMK